jgi:hypothetical protein
VQDLTHRRQWLIRSTGFALGLCLASLRSAHPLQAAPDVKRIRIKNGRTVSVVFGERREAAAGLRPDKAGWLVMLAPDLAVSSADLQDITPEAGGSRWTVPVSLGKLVLDPERFLPSHVYRVEFRRAGQLLGSALIYLYPLPAERVARVKFQDDKEPDEPSSSLAPAPKGELSRGGEAGRTKASR